MDCPRKTVLLIEDDAAIRQSIKDILEIKGYDVLTASDGSEGIRLLGASSPLPCMILLDLMMPSTNGWQFLDMQRSHPEWRAVPVVICSAYEQSARSVRPDGFVAKPVQLNELIGAVKAFCE